MNFASFIAQRIRKPQVGSFSSVISKIVVSSVGSGVFIIIITYAILYGFQNSIQDKIFSFSGHIQLTRYDLNTSLQESPITINSGFVSKMLAYPAVRSVDIFSLKAGLVKTDDEVLGIVIKGVSKDFNPIFFQKNILEGRFINFGDTTGSKEIIISRKNAGKLNLKVNDDIIFYFVQDPPRIRKLKVVGIYETGMEEFDEAFIIGDIELIRRINNWPDNLAGGYDIMVKRFDELDTTSEYVFDNMDYDLGMEKITDKYVAIFDWFSLLDLEVKIFLALIISVVCLNMISSLFIMIMERTNMIGLLKTLGANNGLITRVFFFNGLYLIVKGMLWGNATAAAFCVLQYYFHIIPLDPENYYMNSVPIYWDWTTFGILNSLLLAIMSLVLFIPSLVIARITPIRAIRFD